MPIDNKDVQTISVIVPESPFTSPELKGVRHCLAALDVAKLMDWWPGKPHQPHREPKKVRDIQRSLDWKRVAQIAAYLLQREILEAPTELDECFRQIYEPSALEPGREWPPRVPRVIGYQPSEYPIFSNVLIHVNGADILTDPDQPAGTANLVFDEKHKDLYFTVIDGQHRINGAYFALHILAKTKPDARWEIPAEVFLDLDKRGQAPRRQAQIFIDVNFYQKKVDRSLVADLFPTARGRGPIDDKERAQDIGRRLMLEVGPLTGMVQIPGIKFGVKDVVTLATLNSAVEDVIPHLSGAKITSLDEAPWDLRDLSRT
jgi:DGQHR domain-containing protein